MIFDELSNAACRLSLGVLGAELERGVFKHPPGPARVAPSTGPARAIFDAENQILLRNSFIIVNDCYKSAYDLGLIRFVTIIQI